MRVKLANACLVLDCLLVEVTIIVWEHSPWSLRWGEISMVAAGGSRGMEHRASHGHEDVTVLNVAELSG